MHLLEVSHTMLVLIPDKIYCYARTAFSGEVVVFTYVFHYTVCFLTTYVGDPNQNAIFCNAILSDMAW